MRRREFLAALAGALLLPRIAEAAHRKIWLMGDSLGWMMLPVLKDLAKKDGFVIDGDPQPGSSIISWATKHQKQWWKMRRFKPATIFIFLGANDAYLEPHVRKNERPYLDKMLKRLPAPIIWVGPPKLKRAAAGLEEIVQMLKSAKVPLLDSRTVDVEMWDDDLHPSPRGRTTWATWVAKNTWRKL